jgi:molecular chaperone DnaK
VLQGDLKEIVLLDVLSLSLGVETQGGLFTRLIEHNSTIPLKKSAIFTTVADNQTTVEIHVLQGERELAKHNRSLAKFSLIGIAQAPRGAPQIDVAFDMDANGILNVSAKDVLSGKEQAIRITPSTGLSKEEIEIMILEAKQFAEKDRAAKEIMELHNQIKAQVSIISRSYSELGWLLQASEQEAIKSAIQKVKNLSTDIIDPAPLKMLLEELNIGAEKLSSAMFSLPELAGSQGKGLENQDPEASAKQLIKSAMEDVSSKS